MYQSLKFVWIQRLLLVLNLVLQAQLLTRVCSVKNGKVSIAFIGVFVGKGDCLHFD